MKRFLYMNIDMVKKISQFVLDEFYLIKDVIKNNAENNNTIDVS